MKARWKTRKEKQRVIKPAGAKAKGRLSGAPLKERIVGALKAAGKSGATVKDLAAKLGKGSGNVSVWFHTTGKGIREIKKVAPGMCSSRFDAWRQKVRNEAEQEKERTG